MIPVLILFILGSINIGESLVVDLPGKAILAGSGIFSILFGFTYLADYIISELKKETINKQQR